ncbi:MAG: ferrous iron transport protein B [Allomuricauda sp.]|nr:MAG: ferrous iron transport protein B [Allomuricauda sp.]
MSSAIKVALVGNPNTGKTSVFNQLTGLHQKVGNYPGITVEKKSGTTKLPKGAKGTILDLPGTYSINTTSLDEAVVYEVLTNVEGEHYPDVAVVVSDVENLKRNLFLFTQVKDLEIPTLLVINMADVMPKKGISINVAALEDALDTKIALVSTRKGQGIEELKLLIASYQELSTKKSFDITSIDAAYFALLQEEFPHQDMYKSWIGLAQPSPDKEANEEKKLFGKSKDDLKRLQHKETIKRYQFINSALKSTYTVDKATATGFDARLDRILTHRIFGYLIFMAILLLIFQAIFEWSSYPSDFIDAQFAALSEWVKMSLPSGMFTDLIAEGIIAGIGGIAVFIPQIAFLFLFIALLEESGYMSRVVFLMDKVMRPFGLSGKSVVPLISGTACAIPAVMATRTIESWKERLITILVVPFTTCSARLPVYLILIALVIPDGSVFGFGYQALTLFSLYVLGFLMALLAAVVLHKFLKIKGRSFFMIEMPTYRWPQAKNILYTVIEKTKSFVIGAGKIILAISIVLWFLGSNGYTEEFKNAEAIVNARIDANGLNAYSQNYINNSLAALKEASAEEGTRIHSDSLPSLKAELETRARQQEIASYKLEHSYIGYTGKFIEPLVKPLGYDWKIGIAVLTSFAAREVFVGTLATIYSVGSDEQETIKNRMAAELDSNDQPLFNLASGVSLMLFYAFAMQCMSTLAIVKRETNSWKWPMLQLGAMSIIAYLAALTAYQLLH